MDKEKKYLAKFVHAFWRLNNDIIVLLSSLGVTNEKLVAKQEMYLRWIEEASIDVTKAVDFVSRLDQYDLAERVLLSQMAEVSQFLKNE
ncbi:hypothetical protein HD554DRAFT_2175816 [Boletus coccyginus]|nr:hypothetical protein HD554DRAFT_2175816 [Boletus coccyginus]